MGKDWLHWVKSSSTTKREMKEAAANSTSVGCMCAVFQIFNLLHFQQLPNLNQQKNLSSSHFDNSPFQEEATTSKGLEAPRNSLELDLQPKAMDVASSIPVSIKEQESLNFPVGIHIKTGHEKVSSSPRASASKSRTDDTCSEYSTSSPGTKTPTIVARLMGLDLLPEECSTSPSFSKHQRKDTRTPQSRANRSFFDDDIGVVGARSLPVTPRVSLARRSDVEYHRLSLQINKDSTRRERFRQKLDDDHENTSPAGHYAKQIVKQVKESVRQRAAGLTDITNTKMNSLEYSRRDQNLVLLKPIKKKSRFDVEISPENKKSSVTTSCSPRLRLLDTNNKKKPNVVTNSSNKSPRISSGPSSDNLVHLQEHRQVQKDSKKFGSAKLISSSSRLRKLPPKATDYAIRNKTKEPFSRSTARSKPSLKYKKYNKTPFSNEILDPSGPTLLPLIKKGPSPPATKLPQKQVEMQSHVPDTPLSSKKSTRLLSSNPHHSYTPHHKLLTTGPDNTNGRSTTTLPCTAAAEYKNYIQSILKRAAISDSVTPHTIHPRHTRSHPLDPSIFHHLELFHHPSGPTTTFLTHRCNRKMIFELVDELLSKMTRPHYKSSAVDELCDKILNYPAAKCRVLEDIDALIDTDLSDRYRFDVEEQVEGVVCEIEGGIVEELVRETVEIFGVRTSEGQRQSLTGGT